MAQTASVAEAAWRGQLQGDAGLVQGPFSTAADALWQTLGSLSLQDEAHFATVNVARGETPGVRLMACSSVYVLQVRIALLSAGCVCDIAMHEARFPFTCTQLKKATGCAPGCGCNPWSCI